MMAEEHCSKPQVWWQEQETGRPYLNLQQEAEGELEVGRN